jgi:hypothetical protein
MYTYQWGLKAKGSRPAILKWAKFAWTFFCCVMRKQIRILACVQNNYHVNYKTPSSKTSTLIISLYTILKYRGLWWIGVVTSMTESRNTYRMLTGKSFGSLCFEYRVQDNNVMRLILRIDGGSKETGLVANGSCISFFGFCYYNVGWLLSMSMGWHYVSELRPPVRLLFPQIICEYAEQRWNDIDREIRSWRKTFPNATFSTTNPTWTDPRDNPGLRDEWPATNCLSHGRAYVG